MGKTIAGQGRKADGKAEGKHRAGFSAGARVASSWQAAPWYGGVQLLPVLGSVVSVYAAFFCGAWLEFLVSYTPLAEPWRPSPRHTRHMTSHKYENLCHLLGVHII